MTTTTEVCIHASRSYRVPGAARRLQMERPPKSDRWPRARAHHLKRANLSGEIYSWMEGANPARSALATNDDASQIVSSQVLANEG